MSNLQENIGSAESELYYRFGMAISAGIQATHNCSELEAVQRIAAFLKQSFSVAPIDDARIHFVDQQLSEHNQREIIELFGEHILKNLSPVDYPAMYKEI